MRRGCWSLLVVVLAALARRLVLSAAPESSAVRHDGLQVKPLQYPVWWHAPFWSGSGYSSEAVNFVLSLVRSSSVRKQDVWLAQHGDTDREDVRTGMVEHDRSLLQDLEAQPNKSQPAIVVCHSLPTNWMLPSSMGWVGGSCPPDPRQAAYVYTIGRTMFETDRLPASFVPRCNAMNEVWVPSNFSKEVFIASGVIASKIRVVPEGVNTSHFDPSVWDPITLPQGELVFGQEPTSRVQPPTQPAAPAHLLEMAKRVSAADKYTRDVSHSHQGQPFRFMSSFKWEPRKGWEVLLEAYLSEFTAQDDVEIIIMTKPFQTGSDFKRQMHAWAQRAARARYLQQHDAALKAASQQQAQPTGATPVVTPQVPPFVFNASALPRLYVVAHHVADGDLPRFYKAMDAFVLPSKGEGWGRPQVEAMSMGLPVISTNWSGITAYLDERVGYPIKVEGLVPADATSWLFRGQKWAQPSVSHLKQLMRSVYENRGEAAARGAAARKRMVDQYSVEAIGKLMAKELRRVNDLIPQ